MNIALVQRLFVKSLVEGVLKRRGGPVPVRGLLRLDVRLDLWAWPD